MANGSEKDTIGEGTVVRTYKWGDPVTGTIVRREGDSIFIAWHNSFVEDQWTIHDTFEVWADAPQALRDWRGGVGVFGPTGLEQIEPLSSPGDDNVIS